MILRWTGLSCTSLFRNRGPPATLILIMHGKLVTCLSTEVSFVSTSIGINRSSDLPPSLLAILRSPVSCLSTFTDLYTRSHFIVLIIISITVWGLSITYLCEFMQIPVLAVCGSSVLSLCCVFPISNFPTVRIFFYWSFTLE